MLVIPQIAILPCSTKSETYTRFIAFDNTLSTSRHTVTSTFGSYFVDFTNGPRNLDVTRYRIVPQFYPCRLCRIAFCSVRDARVRDHRNPERFRVDRQPLNAISRRNNCSSTSINKLISRTMRNSRIAFSHSKQMEKTSR